MYHLAFLVAACFAYLHSTALADEKEPPKRPIRLSLDAVANTVKVGEEPKFKLTVRNEGDAPQRIIDLRGGRRHDLQDTYYDLEVRQGGKVVAVPRAVSDPGIIDDGDFLTLKMGEKVTFELTRFAPALGSLPPGKYQARIRFWQDPSQSAKSAIFSPDAEFTVRK